MNTSKTISDEYLQILKAYHAAPTAPFADSDGKWTVTVFGLAKNFQARTILNYGAGKGVLTRNLEAKGLSVVEYDPAVAGKETKPGQQFDFAVCVDVLEHIEEEYIANVLDELQWYITGGGFFSICLKTAKNHTLPDGRNTHILLKSRKWWMEQLERRWGVTIHPGRNWHERELCVVVEKK